MTAAAIYRLHLGSKGDSQAGSQILAARKAAA